MYGLLTLLSVRSRWLDIGRVLFFACLWTETESRSIQHAKKERGEYPAILTEQACSIKDLLYGFWGNFSCGTRRDKAMIISYPTSASGIIVLLKTPPKYRKLDTIKQKGPKNHAYAPHFCRSWCNGSYTMMAKPMKTLELHYPMIQFLIK